MSPPTCRCWPNCASARDQFDIIHFHTDMLHFPMFEDMAARTVTTLHGRLDLKDLPPVYRRWSKFPLVSISDSQRMHLPFANWVGTVYHGMQADARDTGSVRGRARAISPSSAACRRRRGPTGRSRSPSAWACR